MGEGGGIQNGRGIVDRKDVVDTQRPLFNGNIYWKAWLSGMCPRGKYKSLRLWL